MKDKIAIAATAVLLRDGLQSWSVERVAIEAGCAKGLVPYHHGSKKALLSAVAARLGRARLAGRLGALRGSGANALDRLWQTLVSEVRSGEWAAWAALVAEPGIDTPGDSMTDLTLLAAAIGQVLEVPPLRSEEARLAAAALDGLQVALHLGAPEESAREAFHRLWLSLLP